MIDFSNMQSIIQQDSSMLVRAMSPMLSAMAVITCRQHVLERFLRNVGSGKQQEYCLHKVVECFSPVRSVPERGLAGRRDGHQGRYLPKRVRNRTLRANPTRQKASPHLKQQSHCIEDYHIAQPRHADVAVNLPINPERDS